MSAVKKEGPAAPAQVRLSAGEWEALREAMQILRLESTSEALREAIRVLHRQARETAIAEGISAFYGGRPAPSLAPEPTQEELEAVDRMEF